MGPVPHTAVQLALAALSPAHPPCPGLANGAICSPKSTVARELDDCFRCALGHQSERASAVADICNGAWCACRIRVDELHSACQPMLTLLARYDTAVLTYLFEIRAPAENVSVLGSRKMRIASADDTATHVLVQLVCPYCSALSGSSVVSHVLPPNVTRVRVA